MNKLLILAALLGATQTTGVVPEGSSSEDFINSVDKEKINKDIQERLTKSVTEMDLKAIIDKEVEKRVKAILEDKELEEMHKFRTFDKKDWMDYDKLLLTHKLENIMSSMKMKQVLDSMWGPENYEKDDKALKKFTVDFDLDTKEI